MTDIPFPLLTQPGQAPQVAGGRLINCYPESLSQTAAKKYAWFRVPGLSPWGTAPSGVYRGGVVVGGTFYALFGTIVYTYAVGGGAGTALPGSIGLPGSGSSYCWFAVNQASPPNIVVVAPGVGAYVIDPTTGVATYPGTFITPPDSVVYMSGMFVFTAGDGTTQVSGINSLTLNSLSYATAQSKPDVLYRPIPLSNSQLLLCGANTMEVWGSPINPPPGYPFSYVQTIYCGILGPQAICGGGDEDGWGKGVYLIGSDFKVSTLQSYSPTPISIPDLDILIENEPDKSQLTIGCYMSRGHGMVVVQAPDWCWEYDTTLQSWHERQSYLQTAWRGMQPKNVFGKWLCGDRLGPNLLQISGTVRNEAGNPLLMRIETGPLGAFPHMVRVNTIELYMTKGASVATGQDPNETNAMVGISMSRDGGQTWSNPRNVPIGRQSVTNGRARSSIWGHAPIEGVRWRFDESAGLNFGFVGADMIADELR